MRLNRAERTQSLSASEGETHAATRQRPDSDKFPAAQLALLAIIRVAEPIALTSFLPYSWKAALHYHVGNKNDAAFYAGLLIAAFSFAEAITGMYWGGVSDRIGRKPVLLIGCVGTILSLLVVGFAESFWVALGGRLLGGLLNGNVGVIQTMVSEITINPAHEPKAYAIMPAVWSIGTIAGPAIGGLFAERPVFGSTRFPFLLPNLICAAMMVLSIVAGIFFLNETHPDMQPWSTPEDLNTTTAQTPLLPTTSTETAPAVDLATESYGTFNPVEITNEKSTPASSRSSSVSRTSSRSAAFTRPIIVLAVALGLYTFCAMIFDSLIPTYFEAGADPRHAFAGGLGLETAHVGVLMSVNGVIALLIQAVIFPFLATRIGIWRLFVLVTVGHPFAFVLVPFLGACPEAWLTPGIYACLTVRNFFSIIIYPLILILIKEAAPAPSSLGKINGLAASVGGACRMAASPIGGLLFSIGESIDFSPLPWWVAAGVAALAALQIPFIQRQKNKTAHIGTAVDWAACPEDRLDDAVDDDAAARRSLLRHS